MCWSAESRAFFSIQALPICAMGYGHPTIMGNPYIGQYGIPIFMGVFDHPFVWKVDEDKHVCFWIKTLVPYKQIVPKLWYFTIGFDPSPCFPTRGFN